MSRYLGLLSAAQEEWETAEQHFASAWEQANLDGARPMMVRTRLDHARVLLARGGDRGRLEAARLLDEASALAEELELSSVLEWIAAARPDTDTPAPPPVASLSAVLQREGDLWRVDYDGRVVHIRDSKGIRTLAVLLASPGVELPAGDVETLANGSGHGEPPAARRRTGRSPDSTRPRRTSIAGAWRT